RCSGQGVHRSRIRPDAGEQIERVRRRPDAALLPGIAQSKVQRRSAHRNYLRACSGTALGFLERAIASPLAAPRRLSLNNFAPLEEVGIDFYAEPWTARHLDDAFAVAAQARRRAVVR